MVDSNDCSDGFVGGQAHGVDSLCRAVRVLKLPNYPKTDFVSDYAMKQLSDSSWVVRAAAVQAVAVFAVAPPDQDDIEFRMLFRALGDRCSLVRYLAIAAIYRVYAVRPRFHAEVFYALDNLKSYDDNRIVRAFAASTLKEIEKLVEKSLEEEGEYNPDE